MAYNGFIYTYVLHIYKYVYIFFSFFISFIWLFEFLTDIVSYFIFTETLLSAKNSIYIYTLTFLPTSEKEQYLHHNTNLFAVKAGKKSCAETCIHNSWKKMLKINIQRLRQSDKTKRLLLWQKWFARTSLILVFTTKSFFSFFFQWCSEHEYLIIMIKNTTEKKNSSPTLVKITPARAKAIIVGNIRFSIPIFHQAETNLFLLS